MGKKISFLIWVLFCSSSFAKESLSAHVHGKVSLDIAVDKKTLLVLVKGPAESFLGFEHRPKTQKDINRAKKAEKIWKTKLLTLFRPSNLKNCETKQVQWKHHFQTKNHSEIQAEAYIHCQKMLAGQKLIVSLKEKFKKIKTIHLQLLRENQTGLNQKMAKNNFEIKL